MAGRLGFFRKRTAELVAGGAGFVASVVEAGISFVNRFVLVATEVRPALQVASDRFTVRPETQLPAVATSLLGAAGDASVVQAPALAVVPSLRAQAGTTQLPAVAASVAPVGWTPATQRPAFAASLLGASGDAARPPHSPALAFTPRISEYHRDAMPSFDLQQVVYSLTRRVGGNAQAAVGTAWTTPANAISGPNGLHDAAVATVAGSALGSTNGIELGYANSAGKAELAITAATLHVYAEVTGDALGVLSDTVISYNIGAGLVQLEAIAGNFASLVTPRSYPLPLLDSWAEYDALAARVIQTMAAASVGVTARLDAIEIEVVATRTDAL